MAILLLAEHNGMELSEQTAKTVSAAALIGSDIHVLVAGKDVAPIADSAAEISGVTKVLIAESGELADGLAEPLAELIVGMKDGYDTIIATTSSTAKNALPRVAALLDVAQISEIVAVLSADTFKRPIYAGNAIQVVQSTDPIKVITVRAAAFPPAARGERCEIVTVPVGGNPGRRSKHVAFTNSDSGLPDLATAKVIISGGRALGSAEKFQEVIAPVANKLGAAIGASRAAVDAGYAPNDWQVGQTGKVVAPDLYVAVGISGAIQHLAGMKDSKVIVAINNDKDAPIFQIADYGLVGDLFEILPELQKAL